MEGRSTRWLAITILSSRETTQTTGQSPNFQLNSNSLSLTIVGVARKQTNFLHKGFHQEQFFYQSCRWYIDIYYKNTVSIMKLIAKTCDLLTQ